MRTVEIIEGTGALVDVSYLIPGQGWTEKNFDPDRPDQDEISTETLSIRR
jgi:hypothetical protein